MASGWRRRRRTAASRHFRERRRLSSVRTRRAKAGTIEVCVPRHVSIQRRLCSRVAAADNGRDGPTSSLVQRPRRGLGAKCPRDLDVEGGSRLRQNTRSPAPARTALEALPAKDSTQSPRERHRLPAVALEALSGQRHSTPPPRARQTGLPQDSAPTQKWAAPPAATPTGTPSPARPSTTLMGERRATCRATSSRRRRSATTR